MTNRTGLRKLNANPVALVEPGIACRDTHVRLICRSFQSSRRHPSPPSDSPSVLQPRQLRGTDAITLSLRCSCGCSANLPPRLSCEINRRGAAFEIGRDSYRNILDLLCEHRDQNGDLLIWGDFIKSAGLLQSCRFGEAHPVCAVYLREMVERLWKCLCFPWKSQRFSV